MSKMEHTELHLNYHILHILGKGNSNQSNHYKPSLAQLESKLSFEETTTSIVSFKF